MVRLLLYEEWLQFFWFVLNTFSQLQKDRNIKEEFWNMKRLPSLLYFRVFQNFWSSKFIQMRGRLMLPDAIPRDKLEINPWNKYIWSFSFEFRLLVPSMHTYSTLFLVVYCYPSLFRLMMACRFLLLSGSHSRCRGSFASSLFSSAHTWSEPYWQLYRSREDFAKRVKPYWPEMSRVGISIYVVP